MRSCVTDGVVASHHSHPGDTNKAVGLCVGCSATTKKEILSIFGEASSLLGVCCHSEKLVCRASVAIRRSQFIGRLLSFGEQEDEDHVYDEDNLMKMLHLLNLFSILESLLESLSLLRGRFFFLKKISNLFIRFVAGQVIVGLITLKSCFSFFFAYLLFSRLFYPRP